MPETTPLISNTDGTGYYFLKQDGGDGTTSMVRDADGGAYVEGVPNGAYAEEFQPKILGPKIQITSPKNEEPGFFAKLFARKSDPSNSSGAGGSSAHLVKPRKAPIKVEPKVFFANERTFLAWMHISIILAGASIAILAFTGDNENGFSQLYGVIMLPVAVAFIVYAMYQYVRRAYMIRNKHPGPYDDTVGPAVLGVMLMLSIVAQFAIKLYSMSV